MLRRDARVCPSTRAEWQTEAALESIGSLHGYAKDFSAASVMETDQYLALKVIWNIVEDLNALMAGPWLTRIGASMLDVSAARKDLSDSYQWNTYLETLGKRHFVMPPPTALGRFASVLQSQKIVARSAEGKHDELKVVGSPITTRSRSPIGPRGSRKVQEWGPGIGTQPKSWSPARVKYSRIDTVPDFPFFDYEKGLNARALTADEQVVKTAAMAFLQSLCIHHLGTAFWSSQRRGFRLGQTKFQAYVDGHLQFLDGADAAAMLIIKARKRPDRTDRDFSIEWEESAQMALWIGDDTTSCWKTVQHGQEKCHRVFISQNHTEMYITVAEYEDSYVQYLQGWVPIERAGFLSMNRFGPFSTEVPHHVQLLGIILKVLIPLATRSSSLSALMSAAGASAPAQSASDFDQIGPKDAAWVSRLVGAPSGRLQPVESSPLSASAHAFMPSGSSLAEQARSGKWTLSLQRDRRPPVTVAERPSDQLLRMFSNEDLGPFGLAGASPSPAPRVAEQTSSQLSAAGQPPHPSSLVGRPAGEQVQRALQFGSQPTPPPIPQGAAGPGFDFPRLGQTAEFPRLGLAPINSKAAPKTQPHRREDQRGLPPGGQGLKTRPVVTNAPPGFPVAVHRPLGERSASLMGLERDDQQAAGASPRQENPPTQQSRPAQQSALTRELRDPQRGQQGGVQGAGQQSGGQGSGTGYPTVLMRGHG